MLAPILNAYPNWTLLTDPQFVPYLGPGVMTQWPKDTLVYDLESVLEVDHSHPDLFHKPRFDIYCEALGIKRPDPLNWNIHLQPPRPRPDPYIFFQYRGSTAWKQLDRSLWHSVKEGLEHILPVVTECPSDGPDTGNPRALSAVQFASRVAHADLVICHDSGVLWTAHCYNRPTLVLAGPTHPDKLTQLHPSIISALYKGLPCSPCGESKVSQCRLECLQFSAEEIVAHAYDLLQQRWATYPREAVA